ncbi:MAG TPA: glycoside hydrolase family 16 protein, partial [Rhodothermales bacterium]|nr:glycoside hydrolase family 16 protein [Rhodothermales bacterium]
MIKYIFLCSLLAGCHKIPYQPTEWKLVWWDEFSQNGSPDPTKWDYEEGFVRNEESQYYTRNRLENARIEHGNLIIEGRKEKIFNPKYDPNGKTWQTQRQNADYTSASLITLGKASWQYGRLEVRAKVPFGQGAWPAIWMMGINRTQVGWPKCGEIDVLEYIGNRDPKTIYGTIHYPIGGQYKSNGGTIKANSLPSENFHTYAIEWNEKEIRW